MERLKMLFVYIRGNEPHLILENQLFNIVCFVGAILLFIMSLSNAFIQMDIWGIVIPLIAAVLLLTLYYFSRFEQKFLQSALLCVPILYALSGMMWFINGGESGSIIHPIQAYFLLFFAILPRKYHIPFTIFHILSLTTLYVLEYLHPEWITPYKGRNEQMIDQVITLICSILCVYAIMMSIKAMYEDKNKEIEKQKENLEELNTLKDKMLSIISHDVRTPLTQLKSFLSIMTESEIDKEKSDIIFKQIAKNVDETQNLLDTLVTWASIQLKGENDFVKHEKIELKALIRQESGLFTAQVQQKKLTFICEVPEELYIFSDANILALIIRNLLSNAVKFSNLAGEIRIKIKENAEYVILSISDTGVGIAPERLNDLMKFGKNSTTRGTSNEKGSGLGLLLCKEFIEKTGGRLDIESELNSGTTFYVSIPKKAHT